MDTFLVEEFKKYALFTDPKDLWDYGHDHNNGWGTDIYVVTDIPPKVTGPQMEKLMYMTIPKRLVNLIDVYDLEPYNTDMFNSMKKRVAYALREDSNVSLPVVTRCTWTEYAEEIIKRLEEENSDTDDFDTD